MRTCLPICSLSLLQLHSCVAGIKHGSMVDGKARSLDENTGADNDTKSISLTVNAKQGVHVSKHAYAEIEGKALETLVKITSNTIVIKEGTNERATANLGESSPHEKTVGKKEEKLIGQTKFNRDLAKRSVLATYADLMFIRMKGQMNNVLEGSKGTDDSFVDVKNSDVIRHGEPNIATLESHRDMKVFALAVCGDLLYTASECKDIQVFRAPMFEELDCFGSGSGAVHSLMAFEENLYSSHQDNKIRVWKRVKSGDRRCKHKLVIVLPSFKHCVKSMLLNRNYVQVRRNQRKLWIQHADRISAFALGGSRSSESGGSGSPSLLYSASWDKTVKVWSLNNFKCLESFYAHHDAINAIVVIDGSILATASADRTIKLWKKTSYPTRKKKHGLIATLEGHKAAVNALAISADSKVLYSGGSDGTLMAWKKVYSCKAHARSGMKGAISGEVLKQNGKISRGSSLAKQLSSQLNTAISGEVSIGSSGSEELIISRENSLTLSNGLSSIKKVINYHNRLNALSSYTVNFVKKKALIGHKRSVLSVSTVGDNIVCSSSADATIRVWVRACEKATAWEYACLAILAGHWGPVKAIASVDRPTGASILHAQELAAAEDVEEDERPGVIVYSGGLDSKVKVWALNIPRLGHSQASNV